MSITEASKRYHERMFPGYKSKFLETDPEFIERFDNFAFDEVVNSDDLDDRTRMMAILATLVGSQSVDEFQAMVPAALNFSGASRFPWSPRRRRLQRTGWRRESRPWWTSWGSP